jgi:hypothetical protein
MRAVRSAKTVVNTSTFSPAPKALVKVAIDPCRQEVHPADWHSTVAVD